jgi:SAM-dependent methyltransferase
VKRQSGAVRIFLYNWPVYALTWTFVLATFFVLFAGVLAAPFGWALAFGAGGAFVWSLVSVFVSFYIYDTSELASGRWVPRVLGSHAGAWAAIDAGLDAEIELDGVMPSPCVARLDIFDPRFMTSPSIARARARTPRAKPASACSPTALALESDALDAIVVAFSAHEIRDRAAREAFFGELRRALRPGGKVLLVEHLRDVANFLAFGPGFLHFVPRREWLRLASQAKLDVVSETRVTPWVMALALARPR